MSGKELKTLLNKYKQGKCTLEECDLLYQEIDFLKKPNIISEEEQKLRLKQIKKKLKKAIFITGTKVIPIRYQWASAAAVLLLGFLTYFILNPPAFFNHNPTNFHSKIYVTKRN